MCECVYATSSSLFFFFLLSPSVTSLLIAIRGSQSHSVPNKEGPLVSDIKRHARAAAQALQGHVRIAAALTYRIKTKEREHCVCFTPPLFCENIGSPPLPNSPPRSRGQSGETGSSVGEEIGLP